EGGDKIAVDANNHIFTNQSFSLLNYEEELPLSKNIIEILVLNNFENGVNDFDLLKYIDFIEKFSFRDHMKNAHIQFYKNFSDRILNYMNDINIRNIIQIPFELLEIFFQ